MLLMVRDETATGESLQELAIEFLTERITVRELIRERVHHEVREFNRKKDDPVFHGLVQPSETERVLNGRRPGYKFSSRREIDWEAQVALALEAFSRNHFFVIVDDRQAEHLDEEFSIGPKTEVSFVKLVPLVGG